MWNELFLNRFCDELKAISLRATGRAVLLTSLTTMLGFGSLTFTTYRGLGSMGIVLFIGVGTCFLATVFVIPAIMGWVEKNSKR